ncbi:MAG TPA: DUF456 domain-containing protein [Cytophagaceae bacterium]
MDLFLAILAVIFLITGIIGCILPALPGPPLGFIALLILHFTKYAEFSITFLFVMALLVVIVSVLDYLVPIWGTKKFGGTKAGMYGATIGMIAGLFFGPPGIILGPFIGAVVGELLIGKTFNDALKSGTGSFLGFLVGIGLKLVITFVMTFYFFKELFF